MTIVCSACTISHATGIGSSARYGSLAWPPLPVTVTSSRSAEARSGPPRLPIQPDGRVEVMWMAKAPVTGDGVPSASGGHVEEPLVEHEAGPVVALLARLEHEQHPPGQLVTAGGEQLGRADQHRRVGVVPAGVHRVVDGRREVEAGVLVHRQGVHVAPQQDRRAGAGAGEQGGDPARGLVDGDVEGQALERGQHLLLGDGQVVADLRPAVQAPAQLDRRLPAARCACSRSDRASSVVSAVIGSSYARRADRFPFPPSP